MFAPTACSGYAWNHSVTSVLRSPSLKSWTHECAWAESAGRACATRSLCSATMPTHAWGPGVSRTSMWPAPTGVGQIAEGRPRAGVPHGYAREEHVLAGLPRGRVRLRIQEAGDGHGVGI